MFKTDLNEHTQKAQKPLTTAKIPFSFVTDSEFISKLYNYMKLREERQSSLIFSVFKSEYTSIFQSIIQTLTKFNIALELTESRKK